MNKEDKITTPVRFSHLTSYAGIGGMVQSAEGVFVVMPDTRYWRGETEIEAVKRVCYALGIPEKELRKPPIYNNKNDPTLLGYLFPRWAECDKCHALYFNPWKGKKSYDEKIPCTKDKVSDDDSESDVVEKKGKFKEDLEALVKDEDTSSDEETSVEMSTTEKPKNKEKCSGQLLQVTWCVASRKGFLADVSWHWHAHKVNGKESCKKHFDDSYLKIIQGKGTVKCTLCKAEGSFIEGKESYMEKTQPWLSTSPEQLVEKDKGKVLEINDPSTYYPTHEDSLVIPPESRIGKRKVVERLYSNKIKLQEIKSTNSSRRRQALINRIANEFYCKVDEVESALSQIDDGYPNFDFSEFESGHPLYDEYKAILRIEQYDAGEDFVTTHKTNELKDLSSSFTEVNSILKSISNHVILNRLREIRVFKGFTRIDYGGEEEGSEDLTPPDIDGELNWLPAIELYGEGVFFSFDEKILSLWEKLPGVINRAQEISIRYTVAHEEGKLPALTHNITPRFLLLHTFSHLIIRELEVSAGYPASSFSERIYCDSEKEMGGILIYTAVADIVGSLGGIIESGEPKEFLKILLNAFKQAEWCSLDPVCTEHSGQGYGQLNRAACHSCVLTPETSCKYKNIFLDRVFIKGSEEKGIPKFLDFVEING